MIILAASMVENVEEQVVEVDQTETKEETTMNQQIPEDSKSISKQEMTEEDLEDWLDSMIS